MVDAGTFTSRNYPGLHPVDLTCSYTITVSTDSQIKLWFEDFDIQDETNCGYDHVSVSILYYLCVQNYTYPGKYICLKEYVPRYVLCYV